MRLYHGSRERFPIGFVLKPHLPKLEPEEAAVEKVLEHVRAHDRRFVCSLPRSKSVYLVDTPDVDLIERAGGRATHVYEVDATCVEKNDAHWWAEILSNGAYDYTAGAATFQQLLGWTHKYGLSYWLGRASDRPLWEYRARSAHVVAVVR